MELQRITGAFRSVRARILTSILLVTALGMTIAGVTAYLVQRERVLHSIDEKLTSTVEGLQFIADGGEGDQEVPATVRAFLTQAMQRVLPDENESTVGIIDQHPALVPSSSLNFRLDEDPAFIERIVAEADADNVVIGTAPSQTGTLRYVIIPVEIDGDDSSALYVSAYSLDAELASMQAAFQTYAVIAAITLLLVGLVGWVVAGRLLSPIRALNDTAERITETDLSERIAVVGNDDVSELARTVNRMLERLELGFIAQRQLLDDVGHELKTPITIVRGHLELLDPERAEEIVAAKEIAIDELDRMNELVADIALLAKSHTPGFVRTELTSVQELTASVFAKASVLSTEHEWQLRTGTALDADIDARRITQAWLQLAENAVKYSPPGTTIEIRSERSPRDRSRIELSVRDEGVGIPESQLTSVFDRFTRSHEGRGIEGSGLGLSIVAAIAEAHHGEAFAVSAGAKGTKVVMRVPQYQPDPEGSRD